MAQDSPITISGGSPLTIDGPDWNLSNPKELAHPSATKGVTGVDVVFPDGTTSEVPFAGEACRVEVTYGPINQVAFTNPNGKHLHVHTEPNPFSVDYNNPASNRYVSKMATASITRLAIFKNDVLVPGIPAPNGHMVIVIHYH